MWEEVQFHYSGQGTYLKEVNNDFVCFVIYGMAIIGDLNLFSP